MEGVIAVFIPIISIFATVAVLLTFIYFRSRERQMIIERGLSNDQIQELYAKKKSPYLGLKIGVVILAGSIGLTLGLIFLDLFGGEYLPPMGCFIFTGIGFIAAHYIGAKEEKKNRQNQ